MDDPTAKGAGPVWTPHRGEQSERRGRVDRDSAGIGWGEMDRKTIFEDAADAADLDARLIGPLDITAKELLDEIAATIPKPLQPGEVTRPMLMEQEGIKEKQARDLLEGLVRDGELVKRTARGGIIAYRKADDNFS